MIEGRVGNSLLALAAAALAALLPAGCGGVGVGGTGAYVSSLIAGFGSVFVGAVEFDDSGATVLDDDGQPVQRTGNELRLGMTVDVDGSGGSGATPGASASASSFRISTAALGPVDAVDAAAGTLSVLGQQIQVNAATVFDPSLHGGLRSIRGGDVIAAYAMPDAVGGRYLGMRIERAAGASAYRLRGLVSAVDPTQHTMMIGGATLDYSHAAGVPPNLAAGQIVRVRLPGAAGSGTLGVDAFAGAASPLADGDSVGIDGLVTSFQGPGAFAVNGLAVDASGARIDATSAALWPGAFVSVLGRETGGTVQAQTVKILSAGEVAARKFQLVGTITSLDTAAQTFTVRNSVVDYSAAAFSNGSASNLAIGVRVRVQGAPASDPALIGAAQITFF
ncbi:MAG TPA: DUF5666 domain-containing protein [Burkholderiaceae bacterium]